MEKRPTRDKNVPCDQKRTALPFPRLLVPQTVPGLRWEATESQAVQKWGQLIISSRQNGSEADSFQSQAGGA